jgi:sugar lactone lactonase YvrE
VGHDGAMRRVPTTSSVSLVALAALGAFVGLVCAVVAPLGCTLVSKVDDYSAGGGDTGVAVDSGIDADTAPVTCADDQKLCGGACHPLTDEKVGCASAGCAPCSVANAAPGCDPSGKCRVGACLTGYADCNADPADGCETHTDDDVAHCGGCTTACGTKANATMACVAAKCTVSACSTGYADCNKTLDDGCEIHTTDDPKHCGGCSTDCGTPAHTTAACKTGTCTLGPCAAGFFDCDGTVSNGCECGFPNASTACLGATTDAGVDASDADAADVTTADIGADASPIDSGAGPLCQLLGCASGFADCNHDLAKDGCEAALATDATNCGACGVDCDGGACVAGVCQPYVLAKDQAGPGQIAVDLAYVYWSNYGAPSPGTNGSIVTIRKDGLGGLTKIADGQTYSWGLAVLGASVYWTLNAASPSYVGTGKADLSAPWSIAYPTAGKTYTGRSRGLAIDESTSYVYWVNYEANQIWRLPRSSPASAEIVADATKGVSRPNSVFVDADNIYWTNEGTPTTGTTVSSNANTGSIARLSKAAITGTPVVLATAQNKPRGLAVDGTSVYWSNAGAGGTTGSVMKCNRTDGTGLTALASALMNPRELTIDGAYVYFTDYGSKIVARISKTAAPGTAPESLATAQNNPLGIVVDTKHVYWTNYGTGSLYDGSVVRLVK